MFEITSAPNVTRWEDGTDLGATDSSNQEQGGYQHGDPCRRVYRRARFGFLWFLKQDY